MSLTSIPPGTDQPKDVITRKVFISGSELSSDILLSQLSVHLSFNKISSAKLVFQDGSASDRDFILSNDARFKPGNEIQIQLGYHGLVESVFEGIIVRHAVKSRQGSSVMIIEAKDKAIKLSGARKSAYFINKTDDQLIKKLVGTFPIQMDATIPSHPQVVQFEATDWDFILTRAEANGMLVLTDNGNLVIKKPAISTPLITATYGENIWEFEAEMDARRQSKSVKAQSWDYVQQKPVHSPDGSATSFVEPGDFSSSDLGDVLSTQVTLSHPGNLQPDDLKNWANAHALRNKLSKAVGRVRINGNSQVKPGSMITLAGVGNKFEGNVFVTGVLHQFSGTWQTDIQFGWKEDLFYHQEKVMEKPASGLLPGINGLHIGKVLDVVDNEQGGQYRIKVHVPTISTSKEGIWARVATLDAGPERGVYFRPQKDDEVVLGFLNDDPREAIILGYLHSKDLHKSPFPDSAENLEYGFVTKEKVKVVFDDTHKRLTLSVKTDTGEKSIILNTASHAIELKDENTNTIKMDSDGITIESIKGDVVIKGKNVKIN